jgi:hypothetical protein
VTPRRITDALKRHVTGLRKFHRETTLAQVALEMRAEQHLDIRFIVDRATLTKTKQISKSAVSPMYLRRAQIGHPNQAVSITSTDG